MLANFFLKKVWQLSVRKAVWGLPQMLFILLVFQFGKIYIYKHTNIEYTKTTLYSNMKSD